MDGGWSSPAGNKRRVMVLTDSRRVSNGALEWTLHHALLEHDELILLHLGSATPRRSSSPPSMISSFLCRPSSAVSPIGAENGEGKAELNFLHAMRAKCEAEQPKVKVLIQRAEIEGNDKAATILAQAKLLLVDLLVIGQRRSSAILCGCRIGGSISSKGTSIAEFLIENSECLCVGVQKKGQNGGYLLNTRTHKNFWLLG
ncbi:uncharacterized protein LOC122000379 [Zingiber officinale]|nr:uncharacterized protein LOC122000379 [Zingiber officinale]